jgi:hypothetical protein
MMSQTLEDASHRHSVPALIAAMYNRRLTSVDQLTEHLVFKTIRGSGDSTTPLFADLFGAKLIDYLAGVGHPTTRDSLLPSQVIAQDADDTLLRAQLLLKATTDSDLMPTESNWSITVR